MAPRGKRPQPKASRARRGAGATPVDRAGPKNRTIGPKKPFIRALAEVMRFLNATRRPSSIIGGVAVIAHGVARFTADIDASIAVRDGELDWLLALSKQHGFVPRIEDAAQFARENLVLLLEQAETKTPLDLSVALQPFEIDSAKKATTLDFAGVQLRVATLTSLLVFKALASRPQDVNDIKALLATKRPFSRAQVARVLAEFDEILGTDRASEFARLLEAHQDKKPTSV